LVFPELDADHPHQDYAEPEPGQTQKEPHHFSCQSCIKMLKFYIFIVYMTSKRSRKQSRSRIILLSSLEPEPGPHQDAAELEPRQDSQRATYENVRILILKHTLHLLSHKLLPKVSFK
jgi:hypothetical protein